MENKTELEQRQLLYESIANVIDESTRHILYIQFLLKYYPKCYEAIGGVKNDKK